MSVCCCAFPIWQLQSASPELRQAHAANAYSDQYFTVVTKSSIVNSMILNLQPRSDIKNCQKENMAVHWKFKMRNEHFLLKGLRHKDFAVIGQFCGKIITCYLYTYTKCSCQAIRKISNEFYQGELAMIIIMLLI